MRIGLGCDMACAYHAWSYSWSTDAVLDCDGLSVAGLTLLTFIGGQSWNPATWAILGLRQYLRHRVGFGLRQLRHDLGARQLLGLKL